MATSYNATVTMTITDTLTDDPDNGSASHAISNKRHQTSYTDGSGAGNAQVRYEDTRTVASSTDDDLDLAGVLTDRFGNTLTFANIKTIRIEADAANVSNIVLGSDNAAQVSTLFDLADAGLNIPPGGAIQIDVGATSTGYAVTATTADILTITNTDGSNTADYTIILIGD